MRLFPNGIELEDDASEVNVAYDDGGVAITMSVYDCTNDEIAEVYLSTAEARELAARLLRRAEEFEAGAITVVEEIGPEVSAIAENPKAWPVVSATVHCTCPTTPCPKHGERRR